MHAEIFPKTNKPPRGDTMPKRLEFFKKLVKHATCLFEHNYDFWSIVWPCVEAERKQRPKWPTS